MRASVGAVVLLLVGVVQAASKEACELGFWNKMHAQGFMKAGKHNEHSAHYKSVFTRGFRIGIEFFRDKKVLDIGCGPVGSLEWLRGVASTSCADPLAEEYSALGASQHGTTYVAAGVERLPFISGSFDVATSLNNFDHIDNTSRGLREVFRVLRPGGHFLIAVEVHAKPYRCEPRVLPWNFEDVISALGFDIQYVRHQLIQEPNRGTKSLYAHTDEKATGTLTGEWHPAPTTKAPFWMVGIFRKRNATTSVSMVRS